MFLARGRPLEEAEEFQPSTASAETNQTDVLDDEVRRHVFTFHRFRCAVVLKTTRQHTSFQCDDNDNDNTTRCHRGYADHYHRENRHRPPDTQHLLPPSSPKHKTHRGLLRRVSSSPELKSFFAQDVHRRSGVDYDFSLFWLSRRGCPHYPSFAIPPF